MRGAPNDEAERTKHVTRESGEPIVCDFREGKKEGEKAMPDHAGYYMELSKICRVLFCIENYKSLNGS